MVSDVFNSRYDDWKARVVEVYEEFNRRLGGLGSQQILCHEQLSGGVVSITYADGHVVLVNYSEGDVETSYGIVPARDYVVTQTGGEGDE